MLAFAGADVSPPEVSAVAQWENGTSHTIAPVGKTIVHTAGGTPGVWRIEFLVQGGGDIGAQSGIMRISGEGWFPARVWPTEGNHHSSVPTTTEAVLPQLRKASPPRVVMEFREKVWGHGGTRPVSDGEPPGAVTEWCFASDGTASVVWHAATPECTTRIDGTQIVRACAADRTAIIDVGIALSPLHQSVLECLLECEGIERERKSLDLNREVHFATSKELREDSGESVLCYTAAHEPPGWRSEVRWQSEGAPQLVSYSQVIPRADLPGGVKVERHVDVRVLERREYDGCSIPSVVERTVRDRTDGVLGSLLGRSIYEVTSLRPYRDEVGGPLVARHEFVDGWEIQIPSLALIFTIGSRDFTFMGEPYRSSAPLDVSAPSNLARLLEQSHAINSPRRSVDNGSGGQRRTD